MFLTFFGHVFYFLKSFLYFPNLSYLKNTLAFAGI